MFVRDGFNLMTVAASLTPPKHERAKVPAQGIGFAD